MFDFYRLGVLLISLSLDRSWRQVRHTLDRGNELTMVAKSGRLFFVKKSHFAKFFTYKPNAKRSGLNLRTIWFGTKERKNERSLYSLFCHIFTLKRFTTEITNEMKQTMALKETPTAAATATTAAPSLGDRKRITRACDEEFLELEQHGKSSVETGTTVSITLTMDDLPASKPKPAKKRKLGKYKKVYFQALQGCKECQKKLSGGRKKFEEEELQRVREQQKYDEEERLITEQEDREEQAVLTNQSIDDFIAEVGIWSISNDEDERDY